MVGTKLNFMLGQSQEFKSLHRFHDISTERVDRHSTQLVGHLIRDENTSKNHQHREHQEPPKQNDTPISDGHGGAYPICIAWLKCPEIIWESLIALNCKPVFHLILGP